jgi:glutamate-1-semialdehyde 2,1-aminomutase
LIPGGCHTYAKGDDQYPVLAPGFAAYRAAGLSLAQLQGRSASATSRR